MADTYSRPELGPPGSTTGVQVVGTSQGRSWFFGKTIYYVVENRYLNEYRKENGAEPEDRRERTGKTREAREGDVCWLECEEATNTYRRNYEFTLVKYEQWLINQTLQAYYDGVNSWTTGTISAGGSVAGAGATGVAATPAGSAAVAEWLLGDAATAAGVEVLGAGVASAAATASTAFTVLGAGFAVFYITTNIMDSAHPAGEKVGEGWEIIGRRFLGDSLWRPGQNPRWVPCGEKHPCEKPKVTTGGGAVTPPPTDTPPPPPPPKPAEPEDHTEPEDHGVTPDGDGDIRYETGPRVATTWSWPVVAAGGAIASLIVGFVLGFLLGGHNNTGTETTTPPDNAIPAVVHLPTTTTVPGNPTYTGSAQVLIELPCNPHLTTPGFLQIGGGKFGLVTQFTSPFVGTVSPTLDVTASGQSGTISGPLTSGNTQMFSLVTQDTGFGCVGGPYPFIVTLPQPINIGGSTSTGALLASTIPGRVSLVGEPLIPHGGGIVLFYVLVGGIATVLGITDLALHTKKKEIEHALFDYDDYGSPGPFGSQILPEIRFRPPEPPP